MSSKKNKKPGIKDFNPNDAALFDGIFGLPFEAKDSSTIIIPVPWEVTVSYHSGTAKGPDAILEASYQVDLFDPFLEDAWKKGIYLEPAHPEIFKKNNRFRKKAEQYFQLLNKTSSAATKQKNKLNKEINHACEWLNNIVKTTTLKYLKQKKLVVLLGGDHSTPFGFIQSVAEHFGKFSILQIDAHADLRNAYQGLKYSHASIMYNVVNHVHTLEKLVQIGIRDYCDEEYQLTQTHPKIKTFFDRDIKYELYRGNSWDRICNQIIKELGDKVYVSFDIDGLDPKLCPNTGTPVAGGFEVEQILYLLEKIVLSGKQIIAFDLNEVAPAKNNDWDANVAARLLYRIINIAQKNYSPSTKS
ncbi:MAG: agmatinase family protein [Bacteroidia bacterium]|nr:agmatinase family protein [Bacteroidia bacterium]